MGLKLKMTIDGATNIDSGIWRAPLDPQEAASLGQCESRSGAFSVLLVESKVDFNKVSQSISFDANCVVLLNIGSTDRAIIMSSVDIDTDEILDTDTSSPSALDQSGPAPPPPAGDDPKEDKVEDFELSQTLSTGDKLFLSELPAEVRQLGESLLSEVRRLFPGDLNYEPRSAKFDETPAIFWTVKILPQEKALRITVRGTPESFGQESEIDLQLDKFGYSAFLLRHPTQIPSALSIIKQAHLNME